jgi:eukaryotic-like serine/threonine-protein kinase
MPRSATCKRPGRRCTRLSPFRRAGGWGAAARVLASSGDTAQSEKLITDLAKEFPYHTLLNQVKLPVARALISLQRNQPAQAVAALASAKPYELGADGRVSGNFAVMHIRGEAFLRLREGVKAAAEYQNILDHRGVDPTSVLYSLAHLGLGRAYALQDDIPKARGAYQDFFALWKDADSDIPILKAAKAEYEKLK